MTKFGGYKIFRLRLTKYCRGCVPGGVDAAGNRTVHSSHGKSSKREKTAT